MTPVLGVAINENVFLSKVAKSGDQKSLEITFAQVPEKEVSFFDMANSSKREEMPVNEITLRIWSFQVPTYKIKATGNELTDSEKLDRINKDIVDRKNQLIHILERYMSTDDIKFDLHFGIDIDNSNYRQKWLENAVLLEMFKNMCGQFIEMVQPYVSNEALKSRLKLVRQSKDKPYPTLPPGKYLDDRPFFEPMEVPKEATKIAFSDYEIKEGLTNNDIPSRKDADTTEATPEEVRNVFGKS